MTLAEMQGLFADATLLPKIQAAIVIAADGIRTEATSTANHAARVMWARSALADATTVTAAIILRGVLAQNAGATTGQVTGATDATIQTAVNAAINLFVM